MDEKPPHDDDETQVQTWPPAQGEPPIQHRRNSETAIAVGAVVVIPLLFVLLVVFHPWTYAPSSDSDSGISETGSSGYGGGYSETTTDSLPLAPDGSGATQQNNDSPDTTTGGDPGTEAAAITNILQQAQSERQSVVNAVNDALNCGSGLSADQQALQTAQSDRQQLAQTAADTPVDALDGASAIPQELSTALSDSATADGDFAQWVGDLTGSCSAGNTQNSDYTTAQAASNQADQDKQTLLSAWNPIAQQYDQQTWSMSDI